VQSYPEGKPTASSTVYGDPEKTTGRLPFFAGELDGFVYSEMEDR
jgi:hypothetical protein